MSNCRTGAFRHGILCLDAGVGNAHATPSPATLDGPVPSAYYITKTIDHGTRRLLLTTTIDSRLVDTKNTLNAVSLTISTHITFVLWTDDARTSNLQIDGHFVAEFA